MKHYVEIKITSFKQLSELNKIAHLSNSTFGFLYDHNILRIFSNDKSLLKKIGSIKNVPENHLFVICQRVQKKSHKKRINSLKKHLENKGIKYDESKEVSQKNLFYSYYFNCKSLTNKNIFNIYVKNIIVKKYCKGEFSSYGLSNCGATLPFF